MNSDYYINMPTLDRVGHLLDAVMAIDLDDLERIIQRAHHGEIKNRKTPPEVFDISRQALRIFWLFRNRIDAVEIRREVKHD